MNSIRHRTLSLVLLVLGVSMLVIGGTSYRFAAHEVEALHDASLVQGAQLLAGLTQAPLSVAQRAALLSSLERALHASGSAEHVAEHRHASQLAFQVWEEERLVLRSANAPRQPFSDSAPGYADSHVAGHEWRVYALDASEPARRIMVAERSSVRDELTRAVALRTLLPELVGLPPLMLLLWWATGRGLQPLSQLAAAIRQRDPQTLQPLAMTRLPRELDTIVGALNRLLERIRTLRVREKRFIADAAHELRTPLSVLDLHAQNALAADDPADRREALEELRSGVARTTRLVTQLLTLARLDPETEDPPPSAWPAADLLEDVRTALAELSPLAIERRQTLALRADETADWQLEAEHGAIGTLVQNLVGNALQHTPLDGTVTVTLTAERERLTLGVDDQGPGIPTHQRRHVTARFHRAGPGAGTGLGLSIVARLLDRHGGRFALEQAPGGGLRAVATLPRRHVRPQ